LVNIPDAGAALVVSGGVSLVYVGDFQGLGGGGFGGDLKFFGNLLKLFFLVGPRMWSCGVTKAEADVAGLCSRRKAKSRASRRVAAVQAAETRRRDAGAPNNNRKAETVTFRL